MATTTAGLLFRFVITASSILARFAVPILSADSLQTNDRARQAYEPSDRSLSKEALAVRTLPLARGFVPQQPQPVLDNIFLLFFDNIFIVIFWFCTKPIHPTEYKYSVRCSHSLHDFSVVGLLVQLVRFVDVFPTKHINK